MLCNTVLSMQIKLILSVQYIFKGLCANHDFQVMGSCLLSFVGNVVDDVDGIVVLLGRMLEFD